MAEILIIADDVTGAADSAAACAACEFAAIVMLYSSQANVASWPQADILSIDANTRCLSAEEAAATTSRLVQVSREHGVLRPGGLIFKKVDSTLRGHFAAELASMVSGPRSDAEPSCVVMAPALPAQGRATVGGRQLLNGQPVHEGDIPALLAKAGLSCRLIDLASVRAGARQLRDCMATCSRHSDVLLCDAESDDDLQLIAKASMVLRNRAVWAGSAGLAAHLARAADTRSTAEQPPEMPSISGPTLFVVGSAASASRRQAGALAAVSHVCTIYVHAEAVLNSTADARPVLDALQSNRDVLLALDQNEQCSESQANLLTRAVARLIAPCVPLVGALVATGGETARAVLDEFGICRLRIVAEVEPGIPVSVAEGWTRPLPIITKAGGFGSPDALVHCRESLRAFNRSSAPAESRCPSVS